MLPVLRNSTLWIKKWCVNSSHALWKQLIPHKDNRKLSWWTSVQLSPCFNVASRKLCWSSCCIYNTRLEVYWHFDNWLVPFTKFILYLKNHFLPLWGHFISHFCYQKPKHLCQNCVISLVSVCENMFLWNFWLNKVHSVSKVKWAMKSLWIARTQLLLHFFLI